MPVFWPTVVTTYGEVSKQTIHLREWLTMRYAQRLQREGEFDDGFKVSTKTAIFRNNFRISIQVAVARGMAQMLLQCGLTTATLRSNWY